MTNQLRLGVNIDHVATVRNARGSAYPDPLRAARLAEEAGADGITAHLREDRRHISDADIEALYDYFMNSVEPVNEPDTPSDLLFPFNIRFGMEGWDIVNRPAVGFTPPYDDEQLNRGAYIVTGPAHCGECHSPRNFFGAVDQSQALAGTNAGPDGKAVPGITPHAKRGIGDWSKDEIAALLEEGFMPDGDFIGGSMSEVVENSSSHWTEEDRDAVADYLLSLPAR